MTVGGKVGGGGGAGLWRTGGGCRELGIERRQELGSGLSGGGVGGWGWHVSVTGAGEFPGLGTESDRGRGGCRVGSPGLP